VSARKPTLLDWADPVVWMAAAFGWILAAPVVAAEANVVAGLVVSVLAVAALFGVVFALKRFLLVYVPWATEQVHGEQEQASEEGESP
jgi:hypothetical protein